MFTCKPYEVDSDMPIFPSSEDEPVGLDHFLVEPRCKEDWVSGLLDLDALQIEKCFNIEDITSTFDNDHVKLGTDEVYRPHTKGEDKVSEISSEMSQGISTMVHGENNFDAQHTDNAGNLVFGSHKESCSGNTVFENKCGGINRKESKDEETHLSALTNTNNHDYSGGFETMSAIEILNIDNKWASRNNFYSLQNYAELDSSLNLMKYEVFSDENEDKSALSSFDEYSESTSLKHQKKSHDQPLKRKKIESSESSMTSTSDRGKVEVSCLEEEEKGKPLVSPKRSRKPPKRYIEESLEYEFKPLHKKCGVGKRLKDRLQDRYPKLKWHKEFHGEQVVYEDDSFNVGCIQVPFGLPMEKENPKKPKQSPVSENHKDNRVISSSEKLAIVPLFVESQEDVSEDESVLRSSTPKGNSRRKRHISWTPEEVVKLVDGVSQCGVGRWTEIKRLLFSSSSHRTSVDLKDKWRNLLRASCTQSQIKEKVEQGRKQSSNYVSESILWRVRELSVIYPYPREARESQRSKVSCTNVSSFPTGSSNALVPLSTVV